MQQNRPANRLLESFPEDAFRVISKHLEHHELDRGAVLHEPGEEIRDLYFPLDCLISVTVTMQDGRTAETGIVGRLEVAGLNALMGGSETTQSKYLAQIPGSAVRVAARPLKAEFDRNLELRRLLLRYTQASFAQISQNAACNALHTIEQRYARWLLECRDRLASDELRFTHEVISGLLGTRRAGITVVSGKFEQLGLIETKRGEARIIDRAALEKVSCECYAVIRAEYDRLLSRDNKS